jgi:hypothetical protein
MARSTGFNPPNSTPQFVSGSAPSCVYRITETQEEPIEKNRQNDDDKAEQHNKKKRPINREMKQVEEKILLDISDSQFKKRKQMNTEERDKEERRTKWKSHDK